MSDAAQPVDKAVRTALGVPWLAGRPERPPSRAALLQPELDSDIRDELAARGEAAVRARHRLHRGLRNLPTNSFDGTSPISLCTTLLHLVRFKN